MHEIAAAGEDRLPLVDPVAACAIIAGRDCEHSTQGVGSCWVDGRQPLARYEAFRVCDPCLAWAALQVRSDD